MNIVGDIMDTVKTGCELRISYEPMTDRVVFELHDRLSGALDIRLVDASRFDYSKDGAFELSLMLKKMMQDIEIFNANLTENRIKEEM